MLTITTQDMKLLAVIIAAGIEVELFRKPGRPQTVLGSFPDTPENRALVERYERRQVIRIPQKTIMQAYVKLGCECRRLVMEAL